jgi:hypothetical protein
MCCLIHIQLHEDKLRHFSKTLHYRTDGFFDTRFSMHKGLYTYLQQRENKIIDKHKYCTSTSGKFWVMLCPQRYIRYAVFYKHLPSSSHSKEEEITITKKYNRYLHITILESIKLNITDTKIRHWRVSWTNFIHLPSSQPPILTAVRIRCADQARPTTRKSWH